MPFACDERARACAPEPIKIRPLHLAAGDLWAGAEVQIYELLRAFAYEGLAPQALLFNEGRLARKLRECGVRVHVLPETELGGFRLLRALVQFLKRERPQLLHTHGLKANFLGGIAAKWTGVPSLRTVHSRPGSGWLFKLDAFGAHYLQTALVSVSSELTPPLRARFGEKVWEIENGLAVREFNATQNAKPNDGRFHVGFVGRLVPVKRVDLFVEAAALLVAESPGRYMFHIFGEGPERSKTLELISRFQLADSVRMEGFQSDIAPRLAALDVLVMPSDHEGLPMTMLEALALGVPVAAHAVGGMIRVLEATRGGVLVRSHEAGAYAEAVETLLAFVHADPMFSQRARQRLAERYDIARTMREYIALYQWLLTTLSSPKP